MANLGTEQNPLLVAIVGSGPSGFYAAEALIKSEFEVNVETLETEMGHRINLDM